jgi:hypothetical protein
MMLTAAGIAAIAAIFSALFPAINLGIESISQSSSQVDERLITSIEIIQVVGELDSSGAFNDTNGNGLFDIFVWTKNTGTSRILDIDRTGLFISSSGDFQRIPHEVDREEGEYPRWTHSIEDTSSEWGPNVTLKMTITYSTAQSAGHYDAKVTTPNGSTYEYHFKM